MVAKGRIRSSLDEDVRSFIGGVAVGVEGVIETTASTGSVDEEVAILGRRRPGRYDRGGCRCGVDGGHGRESAAADGGLRSFHRGAQSKFAAEILHHAESVLSSPSVAHDVLWIDHSGV